MRQFAAITISLFIALSIGLSICQAAQYDPEVYQAQKSLKARGYNSGTPDGLWGKSTESAIKHFQVDNELPVTGKLDEQTKVKLGIVSTVRSVRGNQQTEKKRLALVIGNSAYKFAPLRNPVNDAKDMATTLRNLGFEVIDNLNVNQREMEKSIRTFGKKLRKYQVGMFYYSGHGIQMNGTNYLIPVNAEIETESDVKYEAVDAGRVLGKMEDAGNNVNIVVLDACRDNPLARSFRTRMHGLARMDAPTGSIIAYATAPGSVAADGEGRNGLYTKYLLENMKIPNLTIEQVFKRVRNSVMNETNNKQVPWESTSFRGDFYLSASASETKDAASSKPPATQGTGLDRETIFWQSIKDSENKSYFEAYLKQYPNGFFVSLAKLKIDEFKNRKITALTPTKPSVDKERINTRNMIQEAFGYYSGTADRIDYDKAKKIFTKAFQMGDPLGKMWLARCYSKGTYGCQKDKERAAEMAEAVIGEVKSLAESGQSEAILLLTSAYFEGLAVSKDYEQAVYWCRKAAEKEQPLGMSRLGYLYANGKGVAKDEQQAVYWYRKAAEKELPVGMTNLGWMYEKGRGVAKDDDQAVYWYKKAAEKEHPSGMNNVGRMYANGRGVAKDYDQAVYWYKKAAEKENPSGMSNLGWMYEKGRGVTKDKNQAVYWYRKAAEKGDKLAKKNLKRLGN